jgi:hypothetical protein
MSLSSQVGRRRLLNIVKLMNKSCIRWLRWWRHSFLVWYHEYNVSLCILSVRTQAQSTAMSGQLTNSGPIFMTTIFPLRLSAWLTRCSLSTLTTLRRAHLSIREFWTHWLPSLSGFRLLSETSYSRLLVDSSWIRGLVSKIRGPFVSHLQLYNWSMVADRSLCILVSKREKITPFLGSVSKRNWCRS